MATFVITEAQKTSLEQFLKKHRKADPATAYLFFIEKKLGIHPVLFRRDKLIYQSADHAVKALEKEGKLWRETEIKLGFGAATINEETKKIYLCPFCFNTSSRVIIGNNTHHYPVDAIYEHVSKCPENKERLDGLPVKRFSTSEDRELIKSFITKHKKSVTKKVYTSVLNDSYFNTKEAVAEDFKQNYLSSITMVEAQNQNRFQFEESFNLFIAKHLEEEINDFVEVLSEIPFFVPYVTQWIKAQEEEGVE